MKNITLLGSTGSIGEQTLEVIRNNRDKFNIISLAVMGNIKKLIKQIDEFEPKVVAVFDKNRADELRKLIGDKCIVLSGLDGLVELVKDEDVNLVVNSVVGSIGLKPTYEALKMKKNLALANKETLVVGGELIMKTAKENNIEIIPIDSEHSAIFQCLNGEKKKDIKKIILTASGGPFRNFKKDEIKNVNYKDALKHPNWSMGNKISIDSATLMNKGLEVIEAKWLFDIEVNDIKTIVHPESIVHSMVEFNDTSVIAQLGLADMKVPIQYALTYPERIKNNFKTLNLEEIISLNFEKTDMNKFPCLKLAYDAIKEGGTMPLVLNAANEVLVEAFLKEQISFYDISDFNKRIMDKHRTFKYTNIDELIELDKEIRIKTEKIICNG